MSMTQQRIHRASGSVGPGFAVVYVENVDHDNFTAICRDQKNYQYQIRTDLVPGKGDRPEAGESWVITKAYGDWVFSHIFTQGLLGAANGPTGTGSGGSGSKRQTAVYTTAPDLEEGQVELGTLKLANAYWIYYIQTDVPARVRLYCSEEARDSDVERTTTTEPPPGLGIVMDYLTADVLLGAPLSPVPEGATFTTPLTRDIPISVTSVNGGQVVVTLTWVSAE